MPDLPPDLPPVPPPEAEPPPPAGPDPLAALLANEVLGPRAEAFGGMRVPPHNLSAEQALLGGLMLENSTWELVADKVREEDFYRQEHRLIFRAVALLAEQDQPFDVVTLAEALDKRKLLADVGGIPYLAEIDRNTGSAANAAHYARIIRFNSVLRQLIRAGTSIADLAFDTGGRSEAEILDAAETIVFRIAEQLTRGGGFRPIEELLKLAVDKIDELYHRDEPITGLPTGFIDFDQKTSGLQPSDLIIVAGRPSMGKCCAADTELLLADGRVTTIGALYRERDGALLTLDADQRFRPARPSHYVDDGHKPVYRVTTRLGRRVTTTLSHPFLTRDGWRPLAELAVGTAIGVPRRLPVFGDLSLRDCEVKLLAYLLADGGHLQPQVRFVHPNPALQADFMAAAGAFGGLRTALHQPPERATECHVTAARRPVRAARARLGGYLGAALESVGLTQRALALSIGASPASVSHWVQGRQAPQPHWYPRLDAVFGRRWRDWLGPQAAAGHPLTHWLAGLGLHDTTGADKAIPAPFLRLRRPLLALFLNRLLAADGWVGVAPDGRGQLGWATVSEGLARQVQHLLMRFGVLATLKALHFRWQGAVRDAWELDVTDPDGLRICLDEIGLFGREASVARARAALADRGADSQGELHWDPIVAIEPLGPRQVYDLTIPETHNFVAADVCVHNTSFAMNLAENVAIKTGKGVAVFSMEMPGDSLAMRMMSSLGQIDQHRVRTGRLNDEDWPRLTSAVTILSQAPMFIDDTPALTPTELRARVRRLARDLKRQEKELGMVVIDYLQLMQAPTEGENRATEISAISRSLKSLAKELNIPVIALSQLNRSLESRPNKRPVMSDLRESGAIEQDADLIVFIYRDEVYHEDSNDKGVAEIIIGKQRNGPIGTVKLAFLGQYTKFENLASNLYGDLDYH